MTMMALFGHGAASGFGPKWRAAGLAYAMRRESRPYLTGIGGRGAEGSAGGGAAACGGGGI
jgi:hypothetical protein